MSEVEDYNRRVAELRSQGRLEEALLVARQATQTDPDDANAWWQLALTRQAKEGWEAAEPALVKVTELAPGFAGGWCELGALHETRMDFDSAISFYEIAIENEPEHVRSLKLLASVLGSRSGADDSHKRLKALRALEALGELSPEEHFALGYVLTNLGEYLDAAHAYEGYTRLGSLESAAYNNLGLAYQKLGRHADALDAYLLALRYREQEKDTPERLAAVRTRVEQTQARLLALRKRVLVHEKDYLPEAERYQYYVSPYELVQADEAGVTVFEEDPKALQKAKQRVYREIELEGGTIEWMPGLTLDKSRAMALLESLSDETQRGAHLDLFDQPALRDFMSRGSLRHFLGATQCPDNALMPHTVWSGHMDIIGPRFAEQYDLVLTRAIESGHVDVVECLFGGRRWVRPEDEERCFEGAHRALARLVEPLTKLFDQADERTVPPAEVERMLANGRLREMLVLLPDQLHDILSRVGSCLRGLSVSYYNREFDAAGAKALLTMGKECAAKSRSLMHQFKEDETFLDAAIAKERKQEAHLSFGKTSVDITKSGVAYGAQKLAPEEVAGVRWGLVYVSNSPPTARFRIAFRSTRGVELDVVWSSSRIEEQRALWSQLIEAALNYILPNLLERTLRQLKEGAATLRIGDVEVVASGIIFEVRGFWSTKKVPCLWRNLRSSIQNGSLVLSDATNAKARAELSLDTVDNAVLLHMLISNHKEA